MKGSIKSQLHEMGLKHINILLPASIDSGISSAKSLLKECVIDKDKCKEGLAALNHYHSRYDEVKNIYKHVHDWSTHGSDAYRYLSQAIAQMRETQSPSKAKVRSRRMGGGWMSS